MNRTASFVPAMVLGLGVLLVSGMRAQHIVPPVQPISSIPNIMLGYVGHDVVIDTAEQRVAGMSHYVMREFRSDSVPAFSVYVGYYDRQVQGKTIHSPKNCMPGAGWEILTSAQVPLPGAAAGGKTNRVILSNQGVRALVYYWYQGRGRQESSEYRVKWDLLRD
ncbi:MAG: EpsI family protein, partial [Gemmatimonadaceae bacterium]|nr:EpsI family protein [Gemmatimonadaceae bacterium]